MSEPAAPDPLFTPMRAGALALPNRIVMAPMTRRRAGPEGVPTELNAMHYAQRASAGLIVSEAAVVTPSGAGYPGSPGIFSDAQEAGWRRVVEAVHGAGGRIALQLWHAGRVSHPAWLGGASPVAPSAVAPAGELRAPPGGPFPTPRALEASEIPGVVDAFKAAAVRARRAGFDGVEVHAAQGYLLDQFLRAGSNRRRDGWGGPADARIRLLLEVVEAVADAWDAGRVGVQVSPTSGLNDMTDPDPRGLFGRVAERLAPLGLAYLHVHEPLDEAGPAVTPGLRRRFPGALVVNGGYDGASARAAVASGRADLVSFGRPFIANPDLPERLALGAPLASPDPATFYGGGAEGYTDYPRGAGGAQAPAGPSSSDDVQNGHRTAARGTSD